jgi:hypothetical protein
MGTEKMRKKMACSSHNQAIIFDMGGAVPSVLLSLIIRMYINDGDPS